MALSIGTQLTQPSTILGQRDNRSFHGDMPKQANYDGPLIAVPC
jgi:hypothetical protein